jgi:hypothetical protein
MHAPSTAIAGVLAACWSGAPAPAVSPEPPLTIERPRGILAITHQIGTRDAFLLWHDLDTGATGEIDHDELAQLSPISTSAQHAAWFSGGSETVRIARALAGPGVVITQLATDTKLDAVNHGGTQFVTCSGAVSDCRTGRLASNASSDERRLASQLPTHDNVELQTWLRDGRIVFRENGTFAIWFVDPNDGKTTSFPLAMMFDAISDDGSTIVWTDELGPGRQVIRWKRLTAAQPKSLELDAASVDCRFTPTAHQIYCVAAKLAIGEPTHLLVIDPATGQSRELARDADALGTSNTVPSPDGRYIAYKTANDAGEQRTMIVDVITGKATPISSFAERSFPIAWLR